MATYDDAYELKKQISAIVEETLENNEDFKRCIKARKATVTTLPSSSTNNKVGVKFPSDSTEMFFPYNSTFKESDFTVGLIVSVWYSYKVNNGVIMDIGSWMLNRQGEQGEQGEKGDTGADGTGISGVTEHYLATSAATGVTINTSGWTTTVQNVTSTNKYLWNYEEIKYTNGDSIKTSPVIIGVYGDTGVGINSVKEYYAANNSNTVAPASTEWSESVPTLTSTDSKYLWNYEVITYTNGNTVTTTAAVIGVYGDTGADGSDASVTRENVYNALTSEDTNYGCFYSENGELYIKAEYIRTGKISADITCTGNLIADKAEISGTVNATSGTIGGLTIAENSISSSNGNFSITSAGVLTATGANISGTVNATSGTIGGFIIGSTYLTCSGTMTINSNTGDIKFWKSTATSNGTYANLDGDGLGSVWRGTDNATYPYAYLNAYAEGGLQLVYRPASTVTTKTFKIHFPYIGGISTYGYCPRIYSSDNLYFEVPNTIVGGNIYGDSDGEYTLGLSDRYWSDVYVDNLHNGSDRKLKSDIETLSDAYTTLFDNLEPVRYKKNRDKTKRYHTGFIAQNVEEAIITAGLTTEEFACYNYDSDNDMRNLCYDEFIALCVNEIQKLKSRVATLERG